MTTKTLTTMTDSKRKDIVVQMETIVNKKMTSHQSDFTEYDRKTIENAKDWQFPMVWIVRSGGTDLLSLGEAAEMFIKNEYYRYDYVNKSPYIPSTIASMNDIYHEGASFYIIDLEGVRKSDYKACMEVYRDIMTPVVEKWEKEHGKLPKPKMKVMFRGITFSELKELIRDCEKHSGTSLLTVLKRFRNYSQYSADHYIDVCYYRRDNEFAFSEMFNGKPRLCGGIIFHGWAETGYQENFSVQLSPSYGWAMHT